jgi:hypothetical protein
MGQPVPTLEYLSMANEPQKTLLRSFGKAGRLALMLGLNRLDGVGLDVKQSILPPKDWTERGSNARISIYGK